MKTFQHYHRPVLKHRVDYALGDLLNFTLWECGDLVSYLWQEFG